MGHDHGQDVDPERPPPLSILLGFGPMVPIVAGGLAAIASDAVAHSPFTALIVLWAAAILLFIAGVRRGYGFAREPTPSPGSLGGTVWMFGVGVASLPLMLVNFGLAVILLMIGYASVALLDPASARRGEAPRHFTRLRPPQMALGFVGLGLLLVASR